MSSLPILSSQTPNSGKIDAARPGNNAPVAEDLSTGSAPFGELLAKQLSPQGRDLKSALLKTLAPEEGDASLADPNASLPALATELRPDGIAVPADLLASLLQQDRRLAGTTQKDAVAAAAATNAVAPAITALRGDVEPSDPATRRALPDVAGEVKPDTAPANNKAGKQVETHEVREMRAAKPDPVADSAFVAALQAGKKAGIPAATTKPDTIIQASTTTTATTGIPNALAATPPAAAPAVTQAAIATPLNQPQWADDFSQKVTWIATQRSQSAELHLNPAQLGPLEISLKLNGDQATLQFTSAHAAVRDAIEQSIPRLRDMLADSGISLGNTTVSDQAPREQQQRGQAGAARGDDNAVGAHGADETPLPVTTRLSRHDGMVDTFA